VEIGESCIEVKDMAKTSSNKIMASIEAITKGEEGKGASLLPWHSGVWFFKGERMKVFHRRAFKLFIDSMKMPIRYVG
jgi:hypothetical protein